MIDWQPIETAPKDGGLILLYCPKYDWIGDCYGAGEWEDFEPYDRGRWLHFLEGEPTHWAPLNPPTP